MAGQRIKRYSLGQRMMIMFQNKPILNWVRWVCLPPALFAVFICLGLFLKILNSFLQLWFEPVGGFILAAAWVISAHLIAPARKSLASTAAFVFGSLLAWRLVGHTWYPENHPKAYQSTCIPFVLTIAGGLLGLAGLIMMALINRKPNQAMHQQPAAGNYES
jgi:hypothetical protein